MFFDDDDDDDNDEKKLGVVCIEVIIQRQR